MGSRARRWLTRSRRESLEEAFGLSVTVSTITAVTHSILEDASPAYQRASRLSLERRAPADRFFGALSAVSRAMVMLTNEEPEGVGRQFTGARFTPGVRLVDMGRRLHKASFDDAVFDRAELGDVHLRKTTWIDARLSHCAFLRCDFRGAVLEPAYAEGTHFDRCDFHKAVLGGTFDGARFAGCDLAGRRLSKASFRGARFHRCDLRSADLVGADLQGASFDACNLGGAFLDGAQLRGARFSDCDLRGVRLSEGDVTDLIVERCHIYGMSLWGTRGEVAKAQDLSLARRDETNAIEIDGLHIASFVSSVLEGNGVRDLVDGFSSSMILLLGRFSQPHKQVLDDVRDGLRDLGYAAVIFDTAAPGNRDASETVSILARLSRFVIVDLTQPKSTPYEVAQFVRDCEIPVQGITRGEPAFSMFSDLRKYPWVMPARSFADGDQLVSALPEIVAAMESRRAAGTQQQVQRAQDYR